MLVHFSTSWYKLVSVRVPISLPTLVSVLVPLFCIHVGKFIF